MQRDKPAARHRSASGQKRELIQAAGCIEVLDLPFAANALDRPPQERPEIGIDVLFVQWLQRIDERVDFEPVGKRLSAAANEYERIDRSRGAADIAGLGQTIGVEREAPNEEFPKFRVMADAIFREHERFSFAVEVGLFDDFDLCHGCLPSIRSRKLLIFSAISAPESS